MSTYEAERKEVQTFILPVEGVCISAKTGKTFHMRGEKLMNLLMARQFNGLQFDCYQDEQQQGSDNQFWATREQIGRLLGYANPGISIGNIHNRNKERLDKFSRVNQIDLPSGGTQMTTVYNFKGLLEICRFSNQPNANAVHGFYLGSRR